MEVRLVTFCDDIKASAAYEGVCLRQRSSQSARHSITECQAQCDTNRGYIQKDSKMKIICK